MRTTMGRDDTRVPPQDPAPAWLRDVPRFELIDGPSPLQHLDRFSSELRDLGGRPGLEVWVKREDLLRAGLGGNKLRNLEFLVGDALARGADTLVTAGRRWSNHCRLTAAAAVVAGMGCHVVLSGPPPAEPGPGQRLMGMYGATVHFTANAARDEREATVQRISVDLRAAGRQPYLIGVGGSSEIGALGQALAGMELADQARRADIRPTAIGVPSATGSTQAGLIVGSRLAGLEARIVGFAVAHPPEELAPVIGDLARRLAERTGLGMTTPNVELRDARGPGYGTLWSEAEEAALLLARTEAVLADPIYTAKGLAGFIAASLAGDLDGPVVFWHGGGTPGLFERLNG
jgi:1-aminocyclopropane-1-carboxylate deaminase/D-cysteine desulfhydrase-like pyridoxal-dependent ACC family enzyme